MVDWDLAVRVGSRLVGEGPQVSRSEAVEAVEELRAGAERSTPLVREFTGLVATERSAPVLVVDRPGWVQANADGFATVIAPLIDKLQEKKGAPGPLTEAIGSRITGVELGAMLGFLGSKVLGQFDPFHDKPGEQGRLLLVAPNIVHVERELHADPHDFRLWVCLHEETHRVQFTAVPWMTDHLRSELSSIVGAVQTDPSELLGDAVKKIGDLVSGKTEGSLLDVFSGPEQKAVIERVTGVMSLLEGHADVVMDGVGPEVIPSVAEIRRKFTQRRKGVGGLDRLLRRLLGPRPEDGAVPRRRRVRPRRGRQGRHGGLQRRLGGAGQPAHQAGDPRPGALDRARPRLMLDPAVAAVRLAVRPWVADGCDRDGRLLRRRRLARAARRDGVRGAQGGRARHRRDRRPRPAGGLHRADDERGRPDGGDGGRRDGLDPGHRRRPFGRGRGRRP